jgi:hypothetical protein
VPPLAQTLSRDDDADGRALSRLALHLAEPSQESDALSHSEQPEMSRTDPCLSPLFSFEAMTIVADIDLERVLILK